MTCINSCKSINLIKIYKEAIELIQNFEEIYFKHIFRNENNRAHELCNNAVNEYLNCNSKIV